MFDNKLVGAFAFASLFGLGLGLIDARLARAADFGPIPTVAEVPEKSEKIDVDKLPKVVVESVKKAMPGARITKAFTFRAEGKLRYFLDDIKVGKKAWELTMTEDGTILKKEECNDEK